MRSRRSANEQVAEVARRRLELLSAELAEIRLDPVDPPSSRDRGGSGEPFAAEGEGRDEDVGVTSGSAAGRHAHRSVGLGGLIAGWVLDRLPPTLQGRVRMSATHLTVVAVLVMSGLGLTAWWVARADGGETTLPPVASRPSALAPLAGTAATSAPASPAVPAPAAGPVARSGATTAAPGAASGAAAAAGASAPATGSIIVDVAGKVRRPGITTLPLGSRVADALQAAGGARHGVALGTLNLARVLADGEQIVVGVPAPPGVAASAASVPGASSAGASGSAVPMVNINTATETELEELPGVGPVTAQSILDFRSENGSFSSVDELLEVSGIGDATLAKIAPYATL